MTGPAATGPAGGRATTPGQLVAPFPPVGPLMRIAYRELAVAASGAKELARAVGDPEVLARPWDPPTCRDPDLRREVWDWLEAVVAWLNAGYAWDVTSVIPPCWPRHPHLVHELGTLADQRRQAGIAVNSNALEDWHRYALPAFTDRMRTRLRSGCDEGHQPWPARSRHTRHTSPAAVADRRRAFDDDVSAVPRPAPPPARPAPPPLPTGPRRLVVVDLDTGEIDDGSDGEDDDDGPRP